MIDAHRLQVKLFFVDPRDLAPRDFVPIFHGWIQTRRLAELAGDQAIDVADYSHVHHGPGVVLVGDAANYSIDEGGGRLGLLYSRKRTAPGSPAERLVAAAAVALAACRQLEAEPALAGRVAFRGDELLVRVNDRLVANDAASFAAWRPHLAALGERLYGGAAVVEPVAGDPRELLAGWLRAPGAPGVAALLERLQ